MKISIILVTLVMLGGLLACQSPAATQAPSPSPAAKPPSTPSIQPTASPKTTSTPASTSTPAATAKSYRIPKPIAGVQMPKQLTFLGGGGATTSGTLIVKAAEVAMKAVWPDVSTRVLLSSSAKNATMIQAGEGDMGNISIDLMYEAYKGGTKRYPTPNTNLRVAWLMPLAPKPVAVLKSSTITDISQLANKRIGLSPAGSGSAVSFEVLLREAYGITKESNAKAGGVFYWGEYDESVQLLAAGDLDAVLVTSGFPNATVETIAISKGLRFLPFNDKVVKLMEAGTYPELFGYSIMSLPPRVYTGQTEPAQGITSANQLVLRKDLPDDVVYNILAVTAADNFKSTAELYPFLKTQDTIGANLKEKWAIPLHPGAEKFWKDLVAASK